MCPDRSVLIGMNVYSAGYIDGMQPVCGVPVLTPGGVGAVTVVNEGVTLDLVGTNSTTFTPLLCPTDEVVVGFEGRSGEWLDAVSLRCAPLDDTGAVGTIVNTSTLGGAFGAPFPATDCSPGEVATGALLHSFNEFVSTIAFHCGLPTIN
jgi:hypothetical protein